MAFIDTVRDKWEGISPRERAMLVLLAVVTPIVLGLVAAGSISKGLAAREAANTKSRRALAALADLRAQGGAKPKDTTLAAMPTTPIALESYLNRAAEKVGITVPKFNPRSPVEREGFTTHVMQIDLSGLTLAQLKDFLEAVETDSQYVAVTSLGINRRFRDEEKDKLDVKLEISSYARVPSDKDKEKDKDKDKGSGKDGAAGSATGAGGS
jgi:type II secretory pathway component PulM